MVAVQALDGQLVRSSRVAEVVSPAYDALTVEQRRRHRQEHPLSYLHVTRSAPDEDDADTVDDATLVRRGRAALERLLAADVFEPKGAPAFFVYELEAGDHRQRGVVCEVRGSEFRRVARPHEATRAARSALLAEHFTTVRAASSPVACTVADGSALVSALARVDSVGPVVEHRSGGGLIQRVWRLDNATDDAAVRAALEGLDLYIIDGHHRASANAQLLERGLDVPLLVSVFAPEELRLSGFHRLVKLPPSIDGTEFLRRVARRFRVTETDTLALPDPGSVAVRSRSRWYRIEFDERPIAGSPLVRLGSLDPCIVERELVQGIIGRDGPADVVYMPDEDALDAVVAEAARRQRLPILVPPVTVADMIEVADAGLTMPPKSTYFTPKVRSGLFLRRYDELFDDA